MCSYIIEIDGELVIDLKAYLDQHENWMIEGCGEHGPMGHNIDYYDDMENRRCNCGRNLGKKYD